MKTKKNPQSTWFRTYKFNGGIAEQTNPTKTDCSQVQVLLYAAPVSAVVCLV